MIKFLDLYKINNKFRKDLEASFSKSLDDSYYILGYNVEKFETEFAHYCDTKYCIGTGNGLDALTLIFKGYIELGKLKKEDKVIVPANTYIASVLSVLHAGLEPVLVEPNPKTYNLSIDNLYAKLTEDVKAILMVHLYGQLSQAEALKAFTAKHNLLLIEDAAQAHGAVTNSQFQELNPNSQQLKAGNLGDAAAFSFYPSKNLGALGDGGAITTKDKALFEVVSLMRNYGSKVKYENEIIGYNSRLDDMQAAFLSIKLKHLDSDNAKRRNIAKRYLNEVKNPKLSLPFYDGSQNHVFHAFVIEVDDRANFTAYLDNHKIGWLIHYPIPPHKQKALQEFSYLKLPITEQIHKRIISLPISPVMTENETQTVIDVLNAY
jgi:dTDP-4-amino-4,6-dideoxygalactose transaminase